MIFLKQHPRFFFLILTFILIICYLFVNNTLLLSDEGFYYPVIKHIAQGELPLQEIKHISIFPLFFFVIGMFIRIFGFANASNITTISFLRGIMLCISLCSIFLFFSLSKKINTEYSLFKTVQYTFSPLFFPFFFLIYTEIFSLLFVLASFYLLLRKKYLLSGFIALISIFIRQDNIFWVGFFCVYAFLDMSSFTWNKRFFIEYIKRINVFICSFFVLGILIILNKGNIAIGDAGKHPLSFHTGNIYFFLLLQFILFPFFHISHISRILVFIKKHPLIACMFSLSLLSFFFFRIDHRYNQLKGPGYFYLRNHLLHLLVLTIQTKIITYLILLFSLLSLVVTKFRNKKMYTIYPFIFLALSMQWLIEQRYAFIPTAFFILFKKEKSSFIEISTVIYSIFLTILIFLIVFESKFFL